MDGVRALLAALMLAGVPRTQPPTHVGFPNSMAALGDSITRAFNTGSLPFTDAPDNAWSTGSRDVVRSQYLRILDDAPAIEERAYNDAVSGATVSDLLPQVRVANAQVVSYVTILIGANDVCARSVEQMTGVADFRSSFAEAMHRLSAGSPRARILVLSIPDVYRLWALFSDDAWARVTWRVLHVCQSLLADPGSTDPADVRRREAVRRRTIHLNAQLRDVCADYIHCRYDDGAVFRDAFSPSDVSSRDHFHPSLEGQSRLAGVSWAATFDFGDGSPPSSTAHVEPLRHGSLVSLAATDDAGVAGIEYRVDAGRFRRYVTPLSLRAGHELRYRAVDENGNVEQTHVLIA
jgi:lysophospholipase L1-like esterase